MILMFQKAKPWRRTQVQDEKETFSRGKFSEPRGNIDAQCSYYRGYVISACPQTLAPEQPNRYQLCDILTPSAFEKISSVV